MKLVNKWIPTAVRVLLGLVFFIFGLNGFLHFIPTPPMEGPAGQFLGALFGVGYLLPLVKAIETLAGLALLSGRLVPFALTLLAPIVVNIALFHFVLTPNSIGMAVFLVAATSYLGWAYRNSFRSLFNVSAKPASVEEESGAPIAQAAE